MFVVLLLIAPTMSPEQAKADKLNGVTLDITMREVAQTDPPESEIIDTLNVLVAFDLETTLRVGNAVVYVTAKRAGESSVRLQYALFVTGPWPDQHVDEALVDFGVPLLIDNIRGKGKSTYRMLIVPQPAAEPPVGRPMPTEASGWPLIPSTWYLFYLAKDSRAMYHFPEFRNTLEYEFEAVRDSLEFKSPGRMNYYFFEGNCTDFVFDTRFDFAIDPSRNRIVARHDREYTGVDVQAALLLNICRWWGYAPELLAVGASGLSSFADYHVLTDRANGQSIPLSALRRTLDFKRQPYPAAYHHAASFVRWLMTTYGRAEFQDLYSKATDLSFERALWSVYEKTLGELEAEWLAYLAARKFSVPEYYIFAKRAAAYHNYTEYYGLLTRAAELADSIPDFVNRELGLAAAQLGRWDESLAYFRALVSLAPADLSARSLLSEALWAHGDTNGCQYQLLRLAESDTSDARPYVLLGDLQMAWRRLDSAAALWEYGLRKTDGLGPAALEFQLRLGRHERSHRRLDSARVLFTQALRNAYQIVGETSASTLALIRLAETLLELDSTAVARPYLEIAAYVADSPQELGRTYLDSGRCHDLNGRRDEALKAYEAVLQLPSTQYDRAAARHYINNIYDH